MTTKFTEILTEREAREMADQLAAETGRCWFVFSWAATYHVLDSVYSRATHPNGHLYRASPPDTYRTLDTYAEARGQS